MAPAHCEMPQLEIAGNGFESESRAAEMLPQNSLQPEAKERRLPKEAGSVEHVVHYPLNGLDLDIARYDVHAFGPAEIMIHNLVQDYLFPRRAQTRAYLISPFYSPEKRFRTCLLSLDDSELALDCRTLEDILLTDSLLSCPSVAPLVSYHANIVTVDPNEKGIGLCRLGHGVVDLMQRYYLENSDIGIKERLRAHYFNSRGFSGFASTRKFRNPIQSPVEQAHLKSYQRYRNTYHRYALFSGHSRAARNFRLETPLENDLGDVVLVPRVVPQGNMAGVTPGRITTIIISMRPYDHPRPRHTSVPRRDYSVAFADTVISGGRPRATMIMFPNRPISEIDHRCRRRSLSRRHIARMFTNIPKGLKDSELKNACVLCRSKSHLVTRCKLLCLHCGTQRHETAECPVSRKNICKCQPFPQMHRADSCTITCVRPCGNPYPPGHHKHENAMTCKSRCCMCGIKGHSGVECKLKRCRCGASHLGQTCRWNPTCKVKGCDRYLCGVHCRECGSTEKPFVGWRCSACLENGVPAGERVQDEEFKREKRAERRTKARRGRAARREGEGQPAEVQQDQYGARGSASDAQRASMFG